MTEAAFKLVNPVWLAFMLATTALPVLRERAEAPAPSPAPALSAENRTKNVAIVPSQLPAWKMPPPARSRYAVFRPIR
jgi:hypothetical protein